MITQETSTSIAIGFVLCKLNKDNHSKTTDLGSWGEDFRIIKALFDIHTDAIGGSSIQCRPEM